MLLLISLWVVFFFLHSLLAANSTKLTAEKLTGKSIRYYRLAYNLLSIIFLSCILYLLLFSDHSDMVFTTGTASTTVAYALIFTGLVIILLAFKNYDLGEFSGIKQLTQKIHHPEKLMVTGLNKYVRNPLYTGIIVFVAGYFVIRPTEMTLASLVCIYLYIYIGTKLEERKLEEVFGADYREYQKKVKMLIPFLF